MFVGTKRKENVVLLEDGHRLLLLVSREDVMSGNHFGVLRSVIIRPTRGDQPMSVSEVNVSRGSRLGVVSGREALHSIHSNRHDVLKNGIDGAKEPTVKGEMHIHQGWARHAIPWKE